MASRNGGARAPALVAGFALAVLAACAPEVRLEGERFPLRADLSASIPTDENPAPVAPPERAENRAASIALPAAQTLAAWPQRGGGPRHDSPHGSLSSAPALLWTVDLGQGNSRGNRVAAAPVVDGGLVFALDAGAGLSAVSLDGALRWQVDLTPGFDANSTISGGGLAAGEGRLVATTGFGEVVALDPATGAVLWRQRLQSAASGAPLLAGGRVYLTSRDGAAWALSASDGRVIWTAAGLPGKAGLLGSAAPTLGGDKIYFPFTSGEIAAFAPDGTPAWVGAVTGERLGRAYAGLGDVTGDPVLSGGRLYLGTAAGITAALDAGTGERLWTASEGALNPPLVVGGSVFVVSDEARLVRLSAATGEVIWQVPMPYFVKDVPKKRKGIFAHFGPVLAGGRIAVVSSDGLLRLFAPEDGALLATAEIPAGAAAAPALAGGMILTVTTRGQLVALR